MASYVLLHGLGGNGQTNWFPWLKNQLELQGQLVLAPSFPQSLQPIYQQWKTHLEKILQGQTHEPTIWIGHSLGCPFGLRYLSEAQMCVDHFVVVAAPLNNLGWPQLTDFMRNFPPSNLPKLAANFTVIGSLNDPYIPVEHTQKFAELLGVEPILLQNREHIWQSTCPEVLACLKIV